MIETYPTRNICFPCWFTNAVIAYGDRTLSETPNLWSYRLFSSRAAGPDDVSIYVPSAGTKDEYSSPVASHTKYLRAMLMSTPANSSGQGSNDLSSSLTTSDSANACLSSPASSPGGYRKSLDSSGEDPLSVGASRSFPSIAIKGTCCSESRGCSAGEMGSSCACCGVDDIVESKAECEVVQDCESREHAQKE